MKFQWIGGATFLLSVGPFRILTDPVFASEWANSWLPATGQPGLIRRVGPLPELDLQDLTMILVSHTHSDHFKTTPGQLAPDTPVVVPSAQAAVVEAAGFRDVAGQDPWQDRTWTEGKHSLRVMAVPARHGVEERTAVTLGPSVGYVIEYRKGEEIYRVYWTGDSVWSDAMEEVKQRVQFVDLLLPNLGAVGEGGPYGRITMDAAEAVRLAVLLQPALIIPIHHHTFSHFAEPVDVFVRKLKSAGFLGRLVVLKEGESVEEPD